MPDVQAVRRIRRVVYEWHCCCQRCGHAWTSHKADPPKYCAKCRRPNWHRVARSYQHKK